MTKKGYLPPKPIPLPAHHDPVKADWSFEGLPPENEWCWVTDGEDVWPAKHTMRTLGWTNDDTWEDFDNEVIAWILMEKPEPPPPRES